MQSDDAEVPTSAIKAAKHISKCQHALVDAILHDG
jgi:hypothetical protein